LLQPPKPAEADPEGAWYTFERGVHKTEGGNGWADVWMRGHFGGEYKGKQKDLPAALLALNLERAAQVSYRHLMARRHVFFAPKGPPHISPGQSGAAIAAERRPGYGGRQPTKPCQGETRKDPTPTVSPFQG